MEIFACPKRRFSEPILPVQKTGRKVLAESLDWGQTDLIPRAWLFHGGERGGAQGER